MAKHKAQDGRSTPSGRPARRLRTHRKAVWALGAAATVLAMGVAAFGIASAASAGTPGSDPNNGTWVGGVVFPGPEPLVLWNVPGMPGVLATCIDNSANGPLHAGYSLSTQINDPVYAELNALYANSGASDTQLAELSALNSQKYDLSNRSVQYSYVNNGSAGLSVGEADAMLANAAAKAGPYSISFTGLVQSSDPNARAGTNYTGTVHVQGSTAPISGAVVSLSGNNVNLSTGAVTTDANGNASFTYLVPQGPNQSFSISGSTVDHQTLNIYSTGVNGQQTLLGAGPGTTETDSANGGVDPIINVSFEKLTAGDPAQTPQVATFDVTDTTLNQNLGTITTIAGAPTPLNGVTAGDTFSFQETAAPAGDYIPGTPFVVTIPANASSGYSFTLSDPKIPALSLATQSNIPAETVSIGRSLSDSVQLGGDDGEDGTLTATLYGPIQSPASGLCADLTLAQYLAGGSQTFTADVIGNFGDGHGNGTYIVTGPTVTRLGCYGWSESVTLTPSRASVTSPANTASESTLVTSPVIAVVTKANYSVSQTGRSLSDAVTLTGDDGESGTISDDLYLAPEPSSGKCVSLTSADYLAGTKIGTYTAPIVARFGDGKGNGTYTVTAQASSSPGCYHWFETATLRPSGAVARYSGVQSTETSDVTTPAIKTQVSQQSGLSGSSLSDKIIVTGITENPAPSSEGTLGVSLYYMPYSTIGQTCASVTASQWASFIAANPSSLVASETDKLSADTTVTSKPYVVPATGLGCYTYSETFAPSGANMASVVTAPGDVTETSSIIAPTVTTKMMTTSAGNSDTFTDTAVVTGLHGIAAIIDDKLLGPVAPASNATDCSAVTFSANQVAGTFTPINVTADGQYATNPLNVAKTLSSQCYTGYESLAVLGSTYYTGKLGETTESGFVSAASSGSGGGGGIDTGLGANNSPGQALLLAALGVAAALAALLIGGAVLLVQILGSRHRRRHGSAA